MKKCSKCSLSKSVSEFRLMKRSADGLTAWCIDCHKQASQEHYLKNKKDRNEAAKLWRKKNKDKSNEISRSHHRRNSVARGDYNKEWSKLNSGLRRATAAKRNAAKYRAIPIWANIQQIKRIYSECKRVQDVTGVRMHVDHIVPLQSKLVCGLHCEANLRIIPGAENEAKRNFWWPDMPEQAYAQGQLFAPELPKQEQMKLED